MASTSSPPEEAPASLPPNWLDLPEDVMSSILKRLDAIEILVVTQKVCVAWRKICKNVDIWRSIDMGKCWWQCHDDMDTMCMQAVDRSCGELREISLGCFAYVDLLHYIADRAPKLRRLQLAFCCISPTAEDIAKVAKKLPNLEELHIYMIQFSKEAFEDIGRCCTQLKSLTYSIDDFDPNGDEEAIAIAQTMPGLRHLSLFGNQLTNVGLQAILNGCPHLESLDLRQCYYLDLEKGALGRTCAQRIKSVMWPDDSVEGYEYMEAWYAYDIPWFYPSY